ncbi:MAG: diguanylate cyclase [Anaerolineae bacterium]|nr:diguanylate cyclase [Anaerolineae bacterium]
MTAILIINAISATISMAVAILAYHRRRMPGAMQFATLAVFEALWTVGYMKQLTAPTLEGKLFWNNVQFIGAVAVPMSFLKFSLKFTRQNLKAHSITWNLLRVMAVVILLVIWSDGWHGWFRISPRLQMIGGIQRLIFENGPAFNIFSTFAYLLVIAGSMHLLQNYLISPRVYRLQIATVLVGILIPWIAGVSAWLGLLKIGLHELTPVAFGVSNLVVAWSLFQYRIFDVVPVAHNLLVEYMPEGVLVLDRQGCLVDINLSAQSIFCLQVGQALGKPAAVLLPEIRQWMNVDDQPFETEICLDCTGSEKCYLTTLTPLLDSRHETTGWLVVMRDITSGKRTERQLRQMAITDPLTGLYNRRHFFNQMHLARQEYIESGRPYTVLLVDVDHFKTVNDTLGHQTGDLVLQMITERCRLCLRSVDVIARYGGEEFIILLPGTRAQQAEPIAERLRRQVADAPIPTHAGEANITISQGITSQEEGMPLTVDQMLERTDKALYLAKQCGRNCVRMWQGD